MSIASSIPVPLTRPRDGDGDFPPPPWVAERFGLRHDSPGERVSDGLLLQATRAEGVALVTARVPDALSSDAETFQGQVTAAYAAIRDAMVSCGTAHAVRIWNYLPAITDRMPDGRDRSAHREGLSGAWPMAFPVPPHVHP